jgi:hypothetical protein
MAPKLEAPEQNYPPRQTPSGGGSSGVSSGTSSPSATDVQQQSDGSLIQVSTVTLWRPAPFKDPELDLAIKSAYDNISGLQASAVQAVGALQGSRMSTGALRVTGGVKGVATGLSTLSNVVASLDSGSSPTNMTLSATPSQNSPGTFDVYVFAPTSTSNNTPILASASMLVRWHAWGT